MNFNTTKVTLAEIPGEVSLAFTITGCDMICRDCHSPELRIKNSGTQLTPELITQELTKHKGLVTCILFLGGEWEIDELYKLLKFCKGLLVKTALYTGRSGVREDVKKQLDYLKTGPYIDRLGGLESERTNQKLINLNNNENITYKFWRRDCI